MKQSLRHRLIVCLLLLVIGAGIRVSEATAQDQQIPREVGASRQLYVEGWTAYLDGNYDRALSLANSGLEQDRRTDSKAGMSEALNLIGTVYYKRGDYDRALRYYSEAAPLAEEARYTFGLARDWSSIGSVHYRLGNYQLAKDYYERSLRIRRQIGNRNEIARALNDLANVFQQLGVYPRALSLRREALRLWERTHDQVGIADVLNDIGWTYDQMKQYSTALTYLRRALKQSRGMQFKWGVYDCVEHIGLIYLKMGRYAEAIANLKIAYDGFSALGNQDEVARTLLHWGDAQRFKGDLVDANEQYQRALAVAAMIKSLPLRSAILHGLMETCNARGVPGLAVFYGKQAVNDFQEMRADIRALGTQLQRSFLHSNEDTYRKLASILISHGRLSEAEDVLALLKDEEFSSLRRRDEPKSAVGYSSAETDAGKWLDQLGELGREANELRTAKEKGLLDPKGQQRLNQLERELLPKANAEFRRTLAAIEKEAPGSVIKTAEVKEAQSLMRYLRELGPGTVALYTVVSTEAGKSRKGWVILLTPNLQKAYEMDVANLDQTVGAFRQTLRSPAYDPQPIAQKLYRMIFLKQQKQGKTLAEDLAAYLRDQKEKTLMWSLDGVLRYVPIAALHDGEQYLVERYRNVVFTPASLPGLTHATSGEWDALGLGVAKRYKGFTALSGVPKELSAIVRDGQKHTSGVLPGAIKWDDEFNEKAMMDSLSEGYNVVHIASHFSYQAANPEKSFLLTGDGGHLEMSKIQDMTTLFEKTDLVTLSACDTAVGSAMKDANGKDVEGFAYITQKLGALAVIASLWPVDDVGTQTLMPLFYRLHETGLSKAEAFQRAQLALLRGEVKDAPSETRGLGLSNDHQNAGLTRYVRDPQKPFAHPYFWAPFILIGNWK